MAERLSMALKSSLRVFPEQTNWVVESSRPRSGVQMIRLSTNERSLKNYNEAQSALDGATYPG